MTEPIASAAVRSVLVINVARIGDTILATPAIAAIAQAYPSAAITVLAHPNRAEVFEQNPLITTVASVTKHRASWRGRLRAKSYDLAFVYGYDKGLVRYALRVAKQVVAFDQRDAGLNVQLTRAVPTPAFQAKHSVLMHLALTDALGIAHTSLRLSYRASQDEMHWAKQTHAARVPAEASPIIGLQIASFPTKGYRDWPLESFIALVERIVEAHPRAHFLIFGGAQERDRTLALHERFNMRSTHFAGELSLRQTAALMRGLDLYIGVDTGPTHIAGAFDVPMVVLYHAYSPSRLLAPFGHPAFTAVDHPRIGADENASMAEISVDAVWAAVAHALAPRPVASQSTAANQRQSARL